MWPTMELLPRNSSSALWLKCLQRSDVYAFRWSDIISKMSHFIEEVNLVGPLTFSLTEPAELKQNMKTYFRNNTLKKFLENK